MAIVIKKRVNFDFLGDEYKDSYINFQSIPVKDFDLLSKEVDKAQEDGKAGEYILELLKKYFIDGKFVGIETLVSDDLEGLDQESVLKCFAIFTGQEIDPKVKQPSKTPSSTTAPGLES